MAFRALEAAENVVWAMEQSALETLLAIAAREHDVTPEALEAYQAKTLKNAEQAQVRDGVAIINANGAMFKRANLFTAVSGATSYDIMRRDLQSAVDQKLKGAILNLDTPGGEASGAGELAEYIASLRGTFPVVAYVNGIGASAGYWIASAAQEIVIDPSAILGSIGVQWAMRSREDPKGTTTHTFISSQSPLKNADPGTKEGGAQIQSVVDAMAQVFVEAVARNRNVDTETVLTDFGKGGILVGKDAIAAGMADRIGNFEGVIAELSAPRRKSRSNNGATMSDETFTAEQRDAAVASARAAEKTRVASLTKIATAHGVPADELTAAIDGDMTVEAFALKVAEGAEAREAAKIEAAKQEEAERLAALKTDEEEAAKAEASKGNEPGMKTEDEQADEIAARIAAA